MRWWSPKLGETRCWGEMPVRCSQWLPGSHACHSWGLTSSMCAENHETLSPDRLGLSGRNSRKLRKDPGNLWELLWKFLWRVRLGTPKPYDSKHLKPPEHFQNVLPLSTAGGRLFFQRWFRRGPLRAGHGIPSSTEGVSDLSQQQPRGKNYMSNRHLTQHLHCARVVALRLGQVEETL